MPSCEETNKACIETHRFTDLKNNGTEFGATTTMKSMEKTGNRSYKFWVENLQKQLAGPEL